MRTSIESWRVGAALVLSIGALLLSSLLPDATAQNPNAANGAQNKKGASGPHRKSAAGPQAKKPAETAQNLRAAGWIEYFAQGQKAAQQTGKPIFMIIT